MPPKRTAKTPLVQAVTGVERGYRSFEQYRQLYPNFPARVSALSKCDIPFVRERVEALRRFMEGESNQRLDWFGRKYDLTPTEARFAVFLAEGGSVAEFAKAFRKSQATVRTHLKAIFRKTGASRQADLSVLVLRRSKML